MYGRILPLPGLELERQCRDCGELKALEEFYFTSAGNGRRENLCRGCKSSRSQENYRKRNVGTNRQYWWKSRGILDFDGSPLTHERFLEIFRGQGERCAICGTTEPGRFDWSPDHNHNTGIVRGVLCSSCNLVLGKMGDSPTLLRQAADYLEGKNGSSAVSP